MKSYLIMSHLDKTYSVLWLLDKSRSPKYKKHFIISPLTQCLSHQPSMSSSHYYYFIPLSSCVSIFCFFPITMSSNIISLWNTLLNTVQLLSGLHLDNFYLFTKCQFTVLFLSSWSMLVEYFFVFIETCSASLLELPFSCLLLWL